MIVLLKSLEIKSFNGPSGVVVKEKDPGNDFFKLKSDEVLVNVKYSGVNFSDLLISRGVYPGVPNPPFTPGYEVSGEVEALGESVIGLDIGSEVFVNTYFGGHSNYVKVKAFQVVLVPEHLSLEEAGGFPVNFHSAYTALIEMARLKEGDRVLIDCATGGLGYIAAQIISSLNARGVGLTSSDQKLAAISDVGMEAYTFDDFHSRSEGFSDSFDVIIDSRGGEATSKYIQYLSPAGRIVNIGMSSLLDRPKNIFSFQKSVDSEKVPIELLAPKSAGLYFLNSLGMISYPGWVVKKNLHYEFAREHKIRPKIDKVFEWREYGEALGYIESKRSKGKVLLSWDC